MRYASTLRFSEGAYLTNDEYGAAPRELGFVREGLRIGEDFDAPLPPDVLETFYGGAGD